MIRLTTLGTFRIDAQGVELPTAGMQPKRLAVLAYLAAARPRGAHRRDTMLAMLWPELDQEHARSALRQSLHALRRTLGPDLFVTMGNEAVALDRAAVSCDLWDLDDAAAQGDDATVATLYAGELAAGLFVGNAPAFEQWLDGERACVRAAVCTSAWRRADAAAAALQSAECVQSARLALSLSELDEGAVRRAMQLVASVGERATALAFYETLTTNLRRELDAEPSAVTRAVAEEVRLGEVNGHGARTAHAVAKSPISEPRSARNEHVRRSVSREPPPGVRRPAHHVPVRRVAAAAVVAVIAIAAAARLAPSATSSLDPRRVLVEEFASESTSPALDTLAHAVTLSARQSLVRLDNIQLLSDRDESDPIQGMDDAGTVVRGAVRTVSDSIELRAEIVDRRSGAVSRTVVTRISSAAASRESSKAAAAFADRVSAMVATALYPGWGAALSQPPSYAGYRAFVDGMRSIRRERHDLAVASFRQAYEEDSSFTAAGLLAGMEYYQMRRYASAESVVTTIAAGRTMLPVVDGHLLEWLQRSLGGDRIGARSAMAAVVAAAPTADLAWLQLAIDNVETARPAEALAALDRIDPDAEFGEGWVAYWATRIEALHIAGSHARELSVTREALHEHPEFRVLVAYELRALAALGRVAEVERIAATLVAAPEAGGLDPRIALRQAALELAAHGNIAASRRVLAVVRAWYASRPEAEGTTLSYEVMLARTAYLMDDRLEARRLYEAILRDHPKCLDCIGALGVLAARDGNRATADSISSALAAVSRPFLFGRPLLWQARIAAASGDRARAAALQAAAFAGGAEFDVMTHTDPDLRALRPDSIYRAFARVDP